MPHTEKVNYHDYLRLDQILSAQDLVSVKAGKPAHDEMLFIVVHQTYELWFKQILTEINSVLDIFNGETVDERHMDLVVSRLGRVNEIMKLLVDQVHIMETMTPLDFLEFRDLLIPSSGFQSMQFRTLENRLGLRRESRLPYNQGNYDALLKTDQRRAIVDIESQASLFDRVEKWLERTPFLQMQGFDFWALYKDTVQSSESLKSFQALFDETSYNEARARGEWRFSYKAIHAALLIQLYRDQPVLQLPFRLLTALADLDEGMTTWRQRHALLARRMLGARVGTGGSSGYQYLREAADKHKIFQDLFQLTTFFVPRSTLPALPVEVEKILGFHYTNSGK
jgi:tryptophan 2,3-dioxygenase